MPGRLNPASVLASLDGVPSYDFSTRREGYPTRCIKCNGPTVEGRIQPQDSPQGSGACSECRIRYSTSGRRWICWDLVFSSSGSRLTECDHILSQSNNYTCPNTSNHASNHCTVSVRDEKHKETKTSRRGPGGEYHYVNFFCREGCFGVGEGGKKAKDH
mmetsp:Transcript_47239/g.115385  ORF Transcript_47239/g.115385 Transcript_47239/m.115385 type:complete len:159 (+) Transcript_47239:135-611(+)